MVMVVLKSKSSCASKVMHISINRRTEDTVIYAAAKERPDDCLPKAEN